MFRVREIKESDFSHFNSLLLAQVVKNREKYNKNGLLQDLEQRLQNLLKIKKTDHRPVILVAVTTEESIVGYLIIHWLYELWADSPEALISSLYVGNEWRNRGVGTLLLQEATTVAIELSCSRIWLENNRLNSVYLKQFYAKRGWRERKDLAVFEFELGKSRDI